MLKIVQALMTLLVLLEAFTQFPYCLALKVYYGIFVFH